MRLLILQLQDSSAKLKKERVSRLSREVRSELRRKLLDEFGESTTQMLLRRLGRAVHRVCGQVFTEELSSPELERNLKQEIDMEKLCKDAQGVQERGIQWFVDAIVDLVLRKKQDTQIL